jgi:hypothetical protein
MWFIFLLIYQIYSENYKIGNAKHTVLRVGAMTGWLGVQIMCWSGMAYLHVD